MEIPPRARGTAPDRTLDAAKNGNTPACAGNGLPAEPVEGLIWKYPRVRGERNHVDDPLFAFWEIPPRARGTAKQKCRHLLQQGNTPACAGNGKSGHTWLEKLRKYPRVRGERAVSSTSCSRSLKYPRVRGERTIAKILNLTAQEIPPRARGTVRPSFLKRHILGNTPACAGNGVGVSRDMGGDRKYPRVRGERYQQAL